MPRIACTSRIAGLVLRPMIRNKAVAAVPRSPPAPYTRYTTCRPSTTTVGSATAVIHLLAPEEPEPEQQRDNRPGRSDLPQMGRHERRVAVGGIELVCVRIGQVGVAFC